jgi:maltose alpha-D-glucosyltransferase/alpha-amylase
VDPALGTLGDLVEFLRVARDRGLRVIADLVVNHTSERHPWFESARSSRTSPYRDWYIWRDTPPEDPGEVVFPGEQQSIWSHDEATDSWYLHHFYDHQPSLNVANPAVRDEITRVMGFWMELGLSGFRVDAVPFLLNTVSDAQRTGLARDLAEPHDFLSNLRDFLVRRRGDAILLGEVNLPHPQARDFVGEDDELTMLFDFTTMQQAYLCLARQDARPLRHTLLQRPVLPDTAQWATFLRNHDELTLDQLSDAERDEVFAAFGPQEHMQIFGRGLRRRLPPMLDDPTRLRMAYSLLFSLPGTPTLFYGEEIGMGENLEVPGRMSVRTPMQWDAGPLGGFAPGEDASRLVRPLPQGPYAPSAGVNVVDQRNHGDSLLAWVRSLAGHYRDCPELAWGEVSLVDDVPDAVLALRADRDGGTVLVTHNLGDEPVDVRVPLPDEAAGTRVVGLLDGRDGQPVEDGGVSLQLERYGTAWYRVVRPDDRHLL